MKKFFIIVFCCTLCIVISFRAAFCRDQMRFVGSSTVYPFATIIAESLSRKNPNIKAPMIESTGTGAGIKIFCEGIGLSYPDAVNASRKIKQSELDFCKQNGVTEIKELVLGLDTILLVRPENLDISTLSLNEIFLALATEIPDSLGNLVLNPYKTWSDINSNLPNVPIKIIGPPSTSGTRDSFLEMVFTKSCEDMLVTGKIKLNENQSKKRVCSSIRSDGPWIDGGENDALIINKVKNSKDTIAIIGYSYYNHASNIKAIAINNIKPEISNLNKRRYPLIRPLYIYFKKAHIGSIPGIEEFIKEASSIAAIGPNGYLVKAGLIPLKNEKK